MTSLLTPEVLITLFTTLGGVIALFAAKIKQAEKEKEEAIAETVETKAAFVEFVSTWTKATFHVNKLISETSVDRFLILQAENGKSELTKTTAIYQAREKGQHVFQFFDVKLDDHYKRLLKDLFRGNPYEFVTDQEQDCVLKRIYEMEGVKYSYLRLIKVYDSDGHRKLTYASFATHKAHSLSKETLTMCDMVCDFLSGTVDKIDKIVN